VLIVVIALMIATLGYLYVSGEKRRHFCMASPKRAYFRPRGRNRIFERSVLQRQRVQLSEQRRCPGGRRGRYLYVDPDPVNAPLTLTATSAALTACVIVRFP